jgi:hypothetical protein
MEKKLKHLEMLQTVITRLGKNSFQLKGWCVTLVSALLALGSKDANKKLILVAYYPVLMFWMLDSYFLWQERLFRGLYDLVRKTSEDDIDFSMDTSVVREETSPFLLVLVSRTILLFYGTMVVAIYLAISILL